MPEKTTTLEKMLSIAITEINDILEEINSNFRFTTDMSQGEEVYDIYMAKKRNGKPKEDYPSKYIFLLDFLRLFNNNKKTHHKGFWFKKV